VTPLLPAGRGKNLRSSVTIPQRIEVMRFMQMQMRERTKDGLKGQTRPLPMAKNMPYYSRFVADAGTPVPDGRMYFALRSIRRNDQRLEESALATAQALARIIGASPEGVTSCALSADGNVIATSSSTTPLGTVHALHALWLKDKTLNAMRDRTSLKGKCGVCVQKTICGGSRTHAFAAAYDWLEADPGCPY